MANVHQRRYGVATTINFELYEVDGIDLRIDAVHATGDTTIMKDEGTPANTGSGFVDEGETYSLALTSAEMEAARVVIKVVDQTATKVWLDTIIIIETTHHPSAQHPNGVTEAGTAQAGAASSITLRSGASSTNDLYLGQVVTIVSGTGAGQSKPITLYDGTTKVATISGTWATNPSSSSVYELRGDAVTEVTIPSAADNAAAVRDVNNTAPAANSLGANVKDSLADTNEMQSVGVNVHTVRGQSLTGTGSESDPWGPA